MHEWPVLRIDSLLHVIFNWLPMRMEPIENPSLKVRTVNVDRTTVVRALHDPKFAVCATCLHQGHRVTKRNISISSAVNE